MKQPEKEKNNYFVSDVMSEVLMICDVLKHYTTSWTPPLGHWVSLGIKDSKHILYIYKLLTNTFSKSGSYIMIMNLMNLINHSPCL